MSAKSSGNRTETTLGKFNGTRAGNYCRLPSLDVPILPDVRVCEECREEIVHKPHPQGLGWGLGTWVHACAPDAEPEHYVRAASRCRYCHSQDAVYRQHAWYDAIECSRCGGVDGFAIGD